MPDYTQFTPNAQVSGNTNSITQGQVSATEKIVPHNYNSSRGNNKFSNHRANNNIDMAKIFVGGLSWQSTEKSIENYFSQFGEVISVEIMKDRVTGDPRGFAFVVFSEDSTVETLLKERHEIDRKVVDVKRAQARGSFQSNPSSFPNQSYVFQQHQQQLKPQLHQQAPLPPGPQYIPKGSLQSIQDVKLTHQATSNDAVDQTSSRTTTTTSSTVQAELNKVFVGGLPLHIDRESLSQAFAHFGTVTDAIVMMDPTHRRSRGFGFVTFEQPEHASKAIEAQPINISGKYVEIKLAMPKEFSTNHQKHNYNQSSAKPTFHGINSAPAATNNIPSVGVMISPQNTPATTGSSNQMLLHNSKSFSLGKYAGLAASYGRNGWRAGYGSNAFGHNGWNVQGWEDYNKEMKLHGFSFDMLTGYNMEVAVERNIKRARIA